MRVQALIPESAVDAPDVVILNGFPRPYEIQFDFVVIGPMIHFLTIKFGTIIDRDRTRRATFIDHPAQAPGNVKTSQRISGMQC